MGRTNPHRKRWICKIEFTKTTDTKLCKINIFFAQFSFLQSLEFSLQQLKIRCKAPCLLRKNRVKKLKFFFL